MRLPTSISCSSAAVLVAAALATYSRPPRRPDSDARPAVMLQTDMRGPDYAEHLGPRAADARRLLGDTLREILRRQFGFLDWDRGPVAPLDTVVIELYQWDAVPPDACLRVVVRGRIRAPDARPCPGIFERWIEIMDRQDWDLKRLGAEWARRLDTTLALRAEELVAERFGLLPLNVRVEPIPNSLQVHVSLRPSDIKAADDPRGLSFRLRARLQDPGPPPTVDRNAELRLSGCVLHAVEADYVCDIEFVLHKGRQLPPDSATRALLLSARLDSMHIHLLKYRPATFHLGPGGFLAPEGGR